MTDARAKPTRLRGDAERARRIEQAIAKPMLVMALLVIPVIAIEQSSVDQPWDTIAVLANWLIWLAFLGELIVMLAVVPDRGRWLRDHPLELAIVVLTPPFLPASLQAARVFRLLRLLRLMRAAVLVRRLLSTEGVRDAAVFAMFTVLGGGAAYAAVEKGQNLSAWDGVWWAITTVTTVGYGDSYPRTDIGRVIAIVVMLVGIGFVAVLTAAAASRFTRASGEDGSQVTALTGQVEDLTARLDAVERRS